MRLVLLIALLLLPRFIFAQTNSGLATTAAPSGLKSPPASTNPKPPASTNPKSSSSAKAKQPTTAVQLQATIDQLTSSNHDLLDLLKQQQAVLQDIQFDRRQQSHHIQSLEERLEQTLMENAKLQNKVEDLEAAAAVKPSGSAPVNAETTPESGTIKAQSFSHSTNAASSSRVTETIAATPAPPPQPHSYLPPAPSEVSIAGVKSWHRVLTLKGNDSRQTDLFQIAGRNWRVIWHNQDPADPKLKGTSGLFINAFPKDDTIPQKVCAKVGTGGDSEDLNGPGNYFLKIEASGGSWELAVEDFR